MLTNGADDGGAAVVLRRLVLGVELGQPLDPSASSIDMVQCVGHVDRVVLRSPVAILCEFCEESGE